MKDFPVQCYAIASGDTFQYGSYNTPKQIYLVADINIDDGLHKGDVYIDINTGAICNYTDIEGICKPFNVAKYYGLLTSCYYKILATMNPISRIDGTVVPKIPKSFIEKIEPQFESIRKLEDGIPVALKARKTSIGYEKETNNSIFENRIELYLTSDNEVIFFDYDSDKIELEKMMNDAIIVDTINSIVGETDSEISEFMFKIFRAGMRYQQSNS